MTSYPWAFISSSDSSNKLNFGTSSRLPVFFREFEEDPFSSVKLSVTEKKFKTHVHCIKNLHKKSREAGKYKKNCIQRNKECSLKLTKLLLRVWRKHYLSLRLVQTSPLFLPLKVCWRCALKAAEVPLQITHGVLLVGVTHWLDITGTVSFHRRTKTILWPSDWVGGVSIKKDENSLKNFYPKVVSLAMNEEWKCNGKMEGFKGISWLKQSMNAHFQVTRHFWRLKAHNHLYWHRHQLQRLPEVHGRV